MDIYIVISTFEAITQVISKMWTCPNTFKRLLRRIAPPHSHRRLDPRLIWSQFSLKITHSYFFKKKKEIEQSTWIDPGQVITFYFAFLPYSFSLQQQNQILYDFLVGTSRFFPVASYSLPQPQQIGGRQKEVCGFPSALLACNKSMRESRFLSFCFLLL